MILIDLGHSFVIFHLPTIKAYINSNNKDDFNGINIENSSDNGIISLPYII